MRHKAIDRHAMHANVHFTRRTRIGKLNYSLFLHPPQQLDIVELYGQKNCAILTFLGKLCKYRFNQFRTVNI